MKINKNLIFGFFLYLIIFLSLLFFLNFSDNDHYISYGMTSGSDDYKYFVESANALKINLKSFSEILEYIDFYSGHAVAYPLILYGVYYVFGPDVNIALILNALILFFCFLLLYKYFIENSDYEKNSVIVFVFMILSMPGAYYVALHIYKDVFLFFFSLSSIYFFSKQKKILGVAGALISHFFRPYNFLIIFLLVLIKKYKSLIVFFLPIAFVAFYASNYRNELFLSIEELNKVALEDLSSYGSSYIPSGNFFWDYIVGLVRFFMLPIPFRFDWDFESKPAILLFLEYFQSWVNYLAIVILLFNPNIFVRTVKKYYLLFGYAFFQASVYSIIFFGNSQPRYRIYYYACITIFLLEVLKKYLDRYMSTRRSMSR